MRTLFDEVREFTPIEERRGLLLKRDDLFCPFGKGDVNGGKLRQCMMLLMRNEPRSVVTACSIHSPQAPICAAACEALGIECTILYGGTNAKSLSSMPMPLLAKRHKAKVVIAAKSGRHNVLYAKARQIASETGAFVVEYGFNMDGDREAIIGSVASQVANLPDVERLCVTCGSGITASGILEGIRMHGRRVGELHLFATAPSRERRIAEAARGFGGKIVFHDMFHDKGFVYEKREPLSFDGIRLHPNYEAKSMKRMLQDGISLDGTAFWIVGSEPTIR